MSRHIVVLLRCEFFLIPLLTEARFFVFAVADDCPRLCKDSRDAGLVEERELAQYVRHLMKYVYPDSVIPAEFELNAILTHVEHEHAAVDKGGYDALFGQYFRFDVSSQLPFFTAG